MIGFPGGRPRSMLFSRIIAQALSIRLGQQVVVEGRPRSERHNSRRTGRSRSTRRLRASYRFLQRMRRVPPCFASCLIARFEGLFDDWHDDAVSLWSWSPIPTTRSKRWQDLVSAARSKDGHLTYGTSGAGSLQHLSTELFRKYGEHQAPAHTLQRRRAGHHRASRESA